MEVSNTDRIIVLVDMDCFYVQVEQKLCPDYQNKPCAVVQYNSWKGGGIIAVNYEARAKGVTRFLRGDEAQKVCPDIHLFKVPEIRGKADLTRYREAGALVLDVLCEYSDCVERASIDEAYIDMTSAINSRMQSAPHVTADQLQNTFVVGWEGDDPESKIVELQKWLQMIYEEEHLYHDRMLAVAAVIVEEMRTAVYEKTGYRCSAGIAHNKMLAKLSCGIHKPNKQTVLPQSSIQLLFKTMPIKKVRNLGGKLGEAIMKKFNVENMGDLIDVPKSRFVSQFGEKTGHWLYSLVRGMDNEPVTSRQLPKSIGCGKNFPGKSSLNTKEDVTHWLKQLSTELEERLVKDQKAYRRFARLLTISVRTHENNNFSSTSRSCPIHVYNAEKLAHDSLLAISKLNTSSSDILWKPSIWTLSMAASKFDDKLDNSYCDIQSYFSKSSGSKEGLTNQCRSIDAENEASDSKTIETVSSSGSKTSNNAIKGIASFFTSRSSAIKEGLTNEHTSTDSTTYTNAENKTSGGKTIETVSSSINKGIASFFTNKSSSSKEVLNIECASAKSTASTVAENKTDSETVESVNNAGLRCTKISDNLNSNIASFFARKQLTTTEALDNALIVNKDENFKNKELDNIYTDSISDAVTHNESSISKMEKASCIIDNSESISPEKQNKTSGFFAKKLKERSESNSITELKIPCDDGSNEPIVSELQENCCISVPSASTSKDACVVNGNKDEFSDLDPELTKVCDKCNKYIPIWEETEHLDYHLALDLSKEFLSKPSSNNSSFVSKSSITGKNISKSKSGRKRGSVKKSSSQAKKPFIQTNTLDAFFK